MGTLLERIAEIAKHEGISIGKLERIIGASKGVVSRAIQNNTDIQAKWIENIVENYPQYNSTWLLTGEGEMFRKDNATEGPKPVEYQAKGAPYYAVDFIGGFDLVMNDQTAVPAAFVSFPVFRDAECWVDISGKSMEPLISSGDIIALKHVEDWPTNILYGEVYALVTRQYRTVKRVRKSAQEGYLRLVPENPDYDQQDIPMSAVIAVYQVLGAAKKIF
ncbi:MAG: hypothetical protein KBS67_05325 [Bacteroidales bacterium]|nr:hypothetical protein [Candidatus Cryptobacteroides equifaecalis]